MHQKVQQLPQSQNIQTIANISKQINTLLNQRKRITENYISHISNSNSSSSSQVNKNEINQAYGKQVIAHINEYNVVRKIVHDFNRNPSFFKNIQQNSNAFWETNQNIERELEKRLKGLKEIDAFLDQLIEQELQKAKQIQQVQQTIRGILNRKQQNHIMKAQPFNLSRQTLFNELQQIKRVKQQKKQQKLQQLYNILQILSQMKSLRKKRLQQCKQSNNQLFTNNPSSSKPSLSKFDNILVMLEYLTKDIQKMIENKKIYQVHQQNQKKKYALLNDINQNIVKLSRQMNQMFEAQIKTVQDIIDIGKSKSQLGYFHEKMIAFFQLSEQELFSTTNQRVAKFIQIQNQRTTELNQVIQGINTTEDTIEIFQNLKHNIQTQALRKKQLLEKISKLNKSHFIEKERRQAIVEKQGKIQSLKISFNKLQTMLQEAVQQADVKSYKNFHSQLAQLSSIIKSQHNQLQKIKQTKRQAAKRIYQETITIQQQYRDLISEMFPQIWLRDNDFNKQQTIADFDSIENISMKISKCKFESTKMKISKYQNDNMKIKDRCHQKEKDQLIKSERQKDMKNK